MTIDLIQSLFLKEFANIRILNQIFNREFKNILGVVKGYKFYVVRYTFLS